MVSMRNKKNYHQILLFLQSSCFLRCSYGRTSAASFQPANIVLLSVPEFCSLFAISSHLITFVLSGTTRIHFHSNCSSGLISTDTLHLPLPREVSRASLQSATFQRPSSGVEPETAKHIFSAFSTMYSVSNLMVTSSMFL